MSSNSTPNAFTWRTLELLLLDDVLVLMDERLVPDENDDPREMIDVGRWMTFRCSVEMPDTEWRNFGAISMEATLGIIQLSLHKLKQSERQVFTFFELRNTDRSVVYLVLAWTNV